MASTLEVWQAQGAGSYLLAHSVPIPTSQFASVLVEDADGDEQLDFVYVDRSANAVVALIADGLGGYTALASAPIAPFSSIVASGDVDEDGDLDLLLIGGTVLDYGAFVLWNNGDGSFVDGGAYVDGLTAVDGELADFDGDGHLDIVFVIQFPGQVATLHGDGSGTFGAPLFSSVGAGSDQFVTTDLRGSGVLDLVIEGPNATKIVLDIAVTNFESTNVSVLLGAGDGSFSLLSDFAAPTRPSSAAAVDIDTDGRPDLVFSGAGTFVGSPLRVAFNRGFTTLPAIYCQPKTSSAGCSASISTSDPALFPTSGAADYSVTASHVQAFKNGIVFASLSGAAALPFSGATLCMQPPLKRGPLMNSTGTQPTACDGSFATLVNDGTQIPLGLDPGPGNTATYQYWCRDPQNGPANLGSALSNALELEFL